MEALLKKKNSALSSKVTADATAFKQYQDAIKLLRQGNWRDAGDKFVRSAELFYQIRMTLEAATIYSEAAEVFRNVDKGESLRTYEIAIKYYCETGKFDLAGHLERKIADIHYRLLHYDEAAAHYKKASNFLIGDKCLDQSNCCLERAAECLIYLGELEEAREIYEGLATSYENSNLHRFEVKEKLLKAILCMWAVKLNITKMPVFDEKATVKERKNAQPIPLDDSELDRIFSSKYDAIAIKLDEYTSVDFTWKGSKHYLLVCNLLKYRKILDIHSFTDHLYYWNNYKQWDRASLMMLTTPINEIKSEELRKRALDKLQSKAVTAAAKGYVAKAAAEAAAKEAQDEADAQPTFSVSIPGNKIEEVYNS